MEESENRDADLIRQQRVNILALQRLKIFNENNEKIVFSTLWEEPVIVIFVRHFGCIACRARVSEIANFYSQMEKKKVRIVFLGNGQPYMIKTFKESLNLPKVEIYTDPSLEVFDACSMNRSFSNLVNFKSLMAMRNLYKKGYRQGVMDKDTGTHRQMGGVVAFRKPGKVLYHFTSSFLGDFDDPDNWPKED